MILAIKGRLGKIFPGWEKIPDIVSKGKYKLLQKVAYVTESLLY